MRVTTDGRWLYRGEPIVRAGLLQLLADALVVVDGRYFLHTWEQLLAIEVDDTPFAIVDFESGPQGDCLVLLSDRGHRVMLGDQASLSLVALPDSGQSTPCVDVGEGLLARLSRSCYYRLVELAHEGSHAQRPALLLASAGSEQVLGYLD